MKARSYDYSDGGACLAMAVEPVVETGHIDSLEIDLGVPVWRPNELVNLGLSDCHSEMPWYIAGAT